MGAALKIDPLQLDEAQRRLVRQLGRLEVLPDIVGVEDRAGDPPELVVMRRQHRRGRIARRLRTIHRHPTPRPCCEPGASVPAGVRPWQGAAAPGCAGTGQ